MLQGLPDLSRLILCLQVPGVQSQCVSETGLLLLLGTGLCGAIGLSGVQTPFTNGGDPRKQILVSSWHFVKGRMEPNV